MPLSQDLKEIYSNYDDTRMFYDTVQLYHPNFLVPFNSPYPADNVYPSETKYPTEIDYYAQSYYLIRDTQERDLLVDDGSTQTFQPYPFNVISPQVGENQQDIGIVLDNVSPDMMQNIEAASENSAVPISMFYRVYIEGSVDSQMTTIRMALTEVVVDMFTVSCKASRVDLFERKFPFGECTYYDNKFKGLLV